MFVFFTLLTHYVGHHTYVHCMSLKRYGLITMYSLITPECRQSA